MHAYIFDNIDIRDLNRDELFSLRKAVPEHGVICIKHQNLDVSDLVEFTKLFGKPVKLPDGLRFNNTLDEYPELARISNFKPDGTLIKQHNAAEYWHVDGDFWQPGQNYIFNFLYSVEVPNQGGETGFADLRQAYQLLDQELKNEIENLRFISSCAAIPDFKHAKKNEHLPDACHPIKHRHVETEKEGLYINYSSTPIEGMSEASKFTCYAKNNSILAMLLFIMVW